MGDLARRHFEHIKRMQAAHKKLADLCEKQQAEIARLERELDEAQASSVRIKEHAAHVITERDRLQDEVEELEKCLAQLDRANGLQEELHRALYFSDALLKGFATGYSMENEGTAKSMRAQLEWNSKLLAGQPVDLPQSLRERCSNILRRHQNKYKLHGLEYAQLDDDTAILIRDLERPVEDK